jgi:exodeoxyribonuclease III
MTTTTLTPKRRTPPAPRQRGAGTRPTRRRTANVEASVLTFNISVAAEPRAAKILSWLRRRRDDVIVLSETSAGTGTQLLKASLEADGYATFSAVEDRERGVLVASRLPASGSLQAASVTVPCRAQGVVLGSSPQLTVLGIYVPSRDRSPEKVARKERFIASLIESIEKMPATERSRLMVLGDYNAVPRDHHPPLPGFFPYEYEFHERLSSLGLSPAHELKPYGSSQPHSWIGRTGLGYLYDYAHLGSELGRRITSCRYLHGPRQQRLSDHAALAVRLRLD